MNDEPTISISRKKSLIKPAPPRSSWELLLEDFLKDSNDRLNQNSDELSSPEIPISQLDNPSIPRSSFQRNFIPSPYRTDSSQSNVPPRRFHITLDELVYLVSQVGRADLYREMVEYIRHQSPLSPPLANSAQISDRTNSKTEKK